MSQKLLVWAGVAICLTAGCYTLAKKFDMSETSNKLVNQVSNDFKTVLAAASTIGKFAEDIAKTFID